MEQLVMLAKAPYVKPTHSLPEGYSFVKFDGSDKDIADWKTIIMAEPAPLDGPDSCYHLMIETFHDIVPTNDIYFVEDSKGQRVATFTVVSQPNGMGYLHMVHSMENQRGKGIGHAMAERSTQIAAERGHASIILTTDDFRLPAIKTYLDAGYYPVVYGCRDNEVNTRWDAVFEKLGYPETVRYEKE